MTITKEDIERLKEIDFLGRVDHELLQRVIAQLTQPYQQEQRIEVANGSAFPKHPMTAMFLWADPDGGVWCLKSGTLSHAIYYPLHRPIKQTVQVTLDKEAPRIAKEILATIDEHHACCVEQVITLCKAIAQEGEDNG